MQRELSSKGWRFGGGGRALRRLSKVSAVFPSGVIVSVLLAGWPGKARDLQRIKLLRKQQKTEPDTVVVACGDSPSLPFHCCNCILACSCYLNVHLRFKKLGSL